MKTSKPGRRALLSRAAWPIALAAGLFAGGCSARSAHRVGAFVIAERPGDDGATKLELYAIEYWGVLPGDTNLSGGGIDLVPATAFEAEGENRAGSDRRSFLLMPPETAEGDVRLMPLANADVVLWVSEDGAATAAELSALSVVASRIGADGGAADGDAARRLSDDALLAALRARLAIENELAEARSAAAEAARLRDEAAASSENARAALDALLDEAESANDEAARDAARRSASLAQLKLAGERDAVASLEKAAAVAANRAIELEAKLANDDAHAKLKAALGGGAKKPAARKPARSAAKKPAAGKGAKK